MKNFFLIVLFQSLCFGHNTLQAQAGPLTLGRWRAECINIGGRLETFERDGRTFNFCNIDHLDDEVDFPFSEPSIDITESDKDGTEIPGIDINHKQHDDQGEDPFSGTFMSNIPISSFIAGASNELILSLNTNSSNLTLTGPEIWGEPIIKPKMIEATITVTRNPNTGAFEIIEQIFSFESFEVNGIQTGENFISNRPNSNSNFEFDLSTGTINAYNEQQLINNLYPETNPILIFSNNVGNIVSDFEIFINSDSDPMIVPGVPGEPPINNLGMAYISTIASFDSQIGLITFHDNLSNGLISDVSIVRSSDGQYFSMPTNLESLVGASFEIEPLEFLDTDLGQDGRSHYFFSDARFSLFNSEGIFASGLLTNIKIETNFYGFTGDVVLDSDQAFLSSPFMNIWRLNPTIQLLGPLATESLISSTNRFTQDGISDTDFTNLEPEPVHEPPTILGTAVAFGFFMYFKKRKQGNRM